MGEEMQVKNEPRKLLVLGAPEFQKPILKKAKTLGCVTAVIDINDDAPAAPFADIFYQCSIVDKGRVLEIAKEFAPDAVISGACDTSVNTVAWLCDELGLSGNSVEAARNATDKVEMLKSFGRAGVPHPAYQVVSKSDINAFQLKVDFPLIVKPTDSAGGRGVNLVCSPDQMESALQLSSEAGVSGDVLIEEFMEGTEVSVEVIVADGVPHVLQVTDKLTSGAPNFYEIGHSQPTMLAGDVRQAVADLASEAVLAVGLVNSAAHVEIMVTQDGPKMIELGARMGGDCISTHLVDNSVVGIDMAEAMIRLSFGEHLEVWDYRDSGAYCAVRFLPSRAGRLIGLRGVDAARKIPGIVCLEVTGRIGRKYSDAVDDSSRFAYVVGRAHSLAAANEICDRALSSLEVVLE